MDGVLDEFRAFVKAYVPLGELITEGHLARAAEHGYEHPWDPDVLTPEHFEDKYFHTR